ncbi:MAG: hypothetical protein KGL39_16330 [Patescibacteria group bacterium]|nr:hypothetical protein [Patescibacteria group bacterium]
MDSLTKTINRHLVGDTDGGMNGRHDASAASRTPSKDEIDFCRAVSVTPRRTLNLTVVTAADRGYFVALKCLLVSLRMSHDCRVVVFDIGLTRRQVQWCLDLGMEVRKIDSLAMPRSQWMWQTWNKPLYINAVGGRVLWIDADCIVAGSLAQLDQTLTNGPYIARDTAAITACRFGDAVQTVTNHPLVYAIHPTPSRFDPGDWPNAGVLGFDLDRQRDKNIMRAWLDMIELAARNDRLSGGLECVSHDTQGWLHWYDQGALQWALESLDEIGAVNGDVRFNDPVTAAGTKSLAELTATIDRCPIAKIIHFPCGQKPYKHMNPDVFGDPASLPEPTQNLTLFVLGHRKRMLDRVPVLPHVRRIDLRTISEDNDWAESRVWQSSVIADCDTEYVGLCTARWNDKYNGECLPIERLHHLRLSPDVVWAARTSWSDWLELSERDHPGIAAILWHLAEQMNVKDLFCRSVWSNNFIAHRDVVLDMRSFIWRCWALVMDKYGARPNFGMDGWDRCRANSYLIERFSMLYFCKRRDLSLMQIPA